MCIFGIRQALEPEEGRLYTLPTRNGIYIIDLQKTVLS